jgi:signal transduction histidine kinase
MSEIFKKLAPLPLQLKERRKAPLDGAIIKTPAFCKKIFGETCLKFYKEIKGEGTYRCPYGFSARAFISGGVLNIFTGLTVRDHSDLAKLRRGDRLPELHLTEDFVSGAIAQHLEQQKVRANYNRIHRERGQLEEAVHEIRNFNAQTKAICEAVDDFREPELAERLKYSIESCFAISQMTSSRLNYLNYKLNPALSPPSVVSLFKKVDKAVRSARPFARQRNLRIELVGQSQTDISAYNFFEQVPAILIQNAMKFSIPSIEITVTVSDTLNGVSFSVENVGHYIHEDEEAKIFGRGFRGREGMKAGIPGTGLGLSFAEQVVKIHGGTLELEVGTSSEFNGTLIGRIKFTVKLPKAKT